MMYQIKGVYSARDYITSSLYANLDRLLKMYTKSAPRSMGGGQYGRLWSFKKEAYIYARYTLVGLTF